MCQIGSDIVTQSVCHIPLGYDTDTVHEKAHAGIKAHMTQTAGNLYRYAVKPGAGQAMCGAAGAGRGARGHCEKGNRYVG
jgi:hypothetical protein